MDKKNIWVIASIVLVIAILAIVSVTSRNTPTEVQGDEVVISVNGQEYARVPLGQEQTITVRQEDGSENVVIVSEHGAVMHSSSCDNQLCVLMGEVTQDNWEIRPNGAFIICLPNRVSVELVTK